MSFFLNNFGEPQPRFAAFWDCVWIVFQDKKIYNKKQNIFGQKKEMKKQFLSEFLIF
jgi:hypothetical protein